MRYSPLCTRAFCFLNRLSSRSPERLSARACMFFLYAVIGNWRLLLPPQWGPAVLLFFAGICGCIIGWEREVRRLRTAPIILGPGRLSCSLASLSSLRLRPRYPSPIISVSRASFLDSVRQRKEKPAGLRTLFIVCCGSCLFTLNTYFFVPINGDSGRVAAQVSRTGRLIA